MIGFEHNDPSIHVAVTGSLSPFYPQAVPVRLPYHPNFTFLTPDQARELHERLSWAIGKLDE